MLLVVNNIRIIFITNYCQTGRSQKVLLSHLTVSPVTWRQQVWAHYMTRLTATFCVLKIQLKTEGHAVICRKGFHLSGLGGRRTGAEIRNLAKLIPNTYSVLPTNDFTRLEISGYFSWPSKHHFFLFLSPVTFGS